MNVEFFFSSAADYFYIRLPQFFYGLRAHTLEFLCRKAFALIRKQNNE